MHAVGLLSASHLTRTMLPTDLSSNAPAPGEESPLDERAMSRLRWRCRRGLLENDLFIERFFHSCGGALTLRQAGAMQDLMDLADNDLLDLLLGRREPEGDLDRPAVHELLRQMRVARGAPAH